MNLTKKIEMSADALEIIARMEWSANNADFHGVIISGKLERKLYLEVNKVLEALGGKWNRKTRAHIFWDDPRPAIQEMLDKGYLKVERDGFYETPLHIGLQMARMADIAPGMTVLEPSAGLGSLCEAILIEAPEANLSVIEKDGARAAKLKEKGYDLLAHDFLLFAKTTDARFDRVVQNPPLELLQDVDHVHAAYNVLGASGKLVSVMGEGAFFRNDRKAREFRCWLDTKEHWTCPLPADTFKESGSVVRSRLMGIEQDLGPPLPMPQPEQLALALDSEGE